MPLKVLFVINSLAGGGAERVMTTVVAASKAWTDRAQIEVALLDDEPDAYSLPDWVTVYRLGGKGGLLQSISLLRALAFQIKPDITVSFLTRANVACAIVMGPMKKPFVLSERVNTTAHLGSGPKAWVSKHLVKMTYPKASRIIAVSQGVGDTLVSDFGVRPERIVAVPNPIDSDAIAARAAEPSPFDHLKPYVVGMGRLVSNKNFGLTITAFARSKTPGNLIILGEGPEREALGALARELGVADRVHFPGFAANPYAVISRAEFMALSSNAEGFPNALVEALACGVAVAATDCQSGPAEVLDARSAPGEAHEGLGGLLVPTNDAAAMTRAFEQLQDPALRKRLTIKGAKRVREYSVARSVDRYWEIIGQALGGRI
jgi:N-acetylgalactosamine-N,N'-diacetylbacillosaminyl-diphospho-undecaprenol 4-alpha-N-acetylgalactosaminyltransferase